ncbi:efflux RND transporter periplasmic adaptor subunit [Bordetella sp. 02P26C-1]|uniref:efflux RND transporter periplasmic adaptor subunit n=1 Tax=Bordetella sp. 02P26C-1 TaxID=2683195 RepID=UPI0013546F5F|nr:efflux RND transporter periplasmic adaptor subunit [Bordetella sp. 02P26C-1]MVW79443.1 efflux RND transporter periplasmic adaptor subunit [Bordetella sp. 02P26C-1]
MLLSFSADKLRHRHLWWLMAVIAIAIVTAMTLRTFRPLSESAGDDSSSGPPPVPVRVIPVVSGAVQSEMYAVGTVTPLARVDIRAQVDGDLVRLHFQEGQHVSVGDLLAEIDDRPYRIRLNAAEGELQEIQAQWNNAAADLKRYERLDKQDSVAAKRLDAARAKEQQEAARLRRTEAKVKEARLQLAHTRITAPVTGRVGMRGIDRGNHIRAADHRALATLVQTAPTSVLFTIPATRLKWLQQAWEAEEDATVEVQAWDAEERRLLARGTLTSLDNRIDTRSATLQLRAYFDNADETLFPNQFVNIRMVRARPIQSLVIPAAAVQQGPHGAYVFVVGTDNRAQKRSIALGPDNASRVCVESGLQAGENVVLEGIEELDEGREVLIVAPSY